MSACFHLPGVVCDNCAHLADHSPRPRLDYATDTIYIPVPAVAIQIIKNENDALKAEIERLLEIERAARALIVSLGEGYGGYAEAVLLRNLLFPEMEGKP